jgi:DNA polymerase III delta prime subunit
MSWVETTRPIRITDLVGQSTLTNDMQTWKNNRRWPTALLFVGPSGTGKTSAARIIGRNVLDDFFDDMNYIETNGSDDRGIDFVRVDLKNALRTKPVGAKRKVILIDEADGLTKAAQDSMRQLIESYSRNALVILTANDESKITPAIKSRCSVYQFKPISNEEGAARLWDILAAMQIPTTTTWGQDLPLLVETMHGDLRASINLLETLPPKPDALKSRLLRLQKLQDENIMEYVENNEWDKIRNNLHRGLDDGVPLRNLLQGLYNQIRKKFRYDIMKAYGDVLLHVYAWPAGDYAFCDYLVAKMKEGKKDE